MYHNVLNTNHVFTLCVLKRGNLTYTNDITIPLHVITITNITWYSLEFHYFSRTTFMYDSPAFSGQALRTGTLTVK